MQAAALVSAGTSRYLEEIRRYPMLEAAEECVLATRWREHGDADAAHKLVTSHLRLVVKIAVGYRGYGLPVSEIISEGNVGLMQAAKRFDPQQGFRFATYAMSERDVVEMNRRLGGDVSLNAQMRDDPDSGEWQDWLVDEGSADQESRVVESEESENRKKALAEALSVLNARERRIFEARRLAEDPSTLEDLASAFGISRERVRQIEVRAFQKVQRAAQIAIAHAQPSFALH